MNQNIVITDNKSISITPLIDENLSIFVYGSIVIRDVETNSVVLKKSF